MKTIDFKNFRLFYGLGAEQYQVIDWRTEFANYLLSRMGGIEGVDLALRIHRSDGPVEFSDEEFRAIKAVAGRKLEEGGIVSAYFYSLCNNAVAQASATI